MNSSGQGAGFVFELCLEDLYSVDLALNYGIGAIELCSALDLGGVSPSAGLIRAVRKRFQGELSVLIRPRPGNFEFSNQEKYLIQEDARMALDMGVDMVVTGALDADANIDMTFLENLGQTVGMEKICFHRAIDQTPDLVRSLENLLNLGIPRVLSSGQASSAEKGAKNLQKMGILTQGKMVVMAGGGIRASNLEQIIQTTGLERFHSSLKQILSGHSQFGNPTGVDEGELQKCLGIMRSWKVSN